jgi:hexosaminidase
VARALAALALAAACLAAQAKAQTIDVTPRPLVAQATAGPAVRIASGDAIDVPSGDAGAASAARYLQDMTLRSRGLELRLEPGHAVRPPIVFSRAAAADLGPEGYELTVDHGAVQITARTDAGLFYGAVTLWRLLTADSGHGAATLAPVTITDHPRFAWRGLMLDSARHYQSLAFVEQLIDRMARDKFNVLQWHLTDDQGWRVQIRRYPRLTSVGAWRAAIDPVTGRPTRYGGFYSQDQIRRIVAYAAARHVTIVPEIEMPGHSLSAILAYPALGAAPADAKTQGDWGIFPSILDPSAATVRFMDNVLAEVMALFPSPWINVGGDEAVKDEWRASPKVQAQLKRLGLKDEEALQGWFTARIGTYLAAHGRRLTGWDDVLNGGAALPADATVMSWHFDGATKALNAGHDTVIATDPTLYFDHRQAADPGEPPGRAKVISVQDVYAFEPVPAGLPADQQRHIIGVQANLWTEHMPTERDVAQTAFPRADAVAEVAWSSPERKDWADFAAREGAELARNRTLGLDADDPAANAGRAASENAGHPGRLVSQQLKLCSNGVALNLAAPRRAQGGPYLVDIMNPCWIYPEADLSAAAEVRIAVTSLPFNFQLGADAAKIKLAAPTTAAGELVVRADGCVGAPIAVLPLAPAKRGDGVTVLSAKLPAAPGKHDLCLNFTRRRLDPMWVIGSVELEPAVRNPAP